MLANTAFAGLGGISGFPSRVEAYQPAGDLYLEFIGESALLSRELDITTGLCTAKRRVQGAEVSARMICHCEQDLIFYEATAKNPFSVKVNYRRVADEKAKTETIYNQEGLEFTCSFVGSGFRTLARVFTDGKKAVGDDGILVENATYLRIAADILAEPDTEKPLPEPEEQTFQTHCDAFKEKMGGFSFRLFGEELKLPTDQRLQRYCAGEEDLGLEELYCTYARYLLLSCSLCGKYPANLQGKWNDNINPPWKCDYHNNINLQMCYWFAEKCGMGECAKLLSDFALKLQKNSGDIPKKLFGCRGTFIPLQTDGWAIPTPESFGWGVWVGAAAWIAQHLWWHYCYSGDVTYLREEAYGFFKSTALFFEDFLEEDEHGIFQIIPSQSPENGFQEGGQGPEVTLCVSSSFDVQLVQDLLTYCIESAKILGVDEDKQELWKDIKNRLPKPQVASDGRIVEWDKDGYTENQPGHRHLSPLYGIFPSELFTPEKNPKLYDACIKSLDYRMSHEGGPSGWSRAWCANVYARVKNAEKFYQHFSILLNDFSTKSLLDLHPPGVFQIDGNMGGASAAIEAVATYYDEKVYLLGALPEHWRQGEVKGFCTPGGHKISFAWKDGKLTTLAVELGYGETIEIAPCQGLKAGIKLSGKAGEKVNVL